MATITQVIKKKRCFKLGIDGYNDIDVPYQRSLYLKRY